MLTRGKTSPKSGLVAWLEKRLPIKAFIESQLTEYYAPKNFNVWYYFGVLALVVLVLQLATGIVLAMFYKPGEATAFDSVEFIMREVEWGWLIRYLHSTGASAFFVVVYLHMFRALLYGSYKAPRELLWIFGMLVYFTLMAEAFMGYVLPWGNMSFWGAQVIVNLFGTIPVIGPGLVDWIRGDYGIADATLSRFFSLHVVAIPLALLLLVTLHLVALRTSGSNNPDGVEIKEHLDANGKPLDGIPFHPYHTVKDLVSVGVFFVLFAAIVFFVPTFGGLFLEGENFEPANTLSTPEHIAPVWYFTPYYAILRAVPDQRLGALLMLLAVVSFLFLPWLDRSPVRSIRYKGALSRFFLAMFAISFVVLGYLGLQPAEGRYVLLAQVFTGFYFAFFWLMPLYSKLDRAKPVPERVGRLANPAAPPEVAGPPADRASRNLR
jgi:ubiquinol-cytochrome c reductase cytochrome b subunit